MHLAPLIDYEHLQHYEKIFAKAIDKIDTDKDLFPQGKRHKRPVLQLEASNPKIYWTN